MTASQRKLFGVSGKEVDTVLLGNRCHIRLNKVFSPGPDFVSAIIFCLQAISDNSGLSIYGSKINDAVSVY